MFLKRFLFDTITPGLFRFMLAFLVVVYHSVDFLSVGPYAVFVFFMLSGYWIFKMYSEKYSTYESSYWVYIRSRLFRLLPIYWVVLFISLVLYLLNPLFWSMLSQMKSDYPEIIYKNLIILGVDHAPFRFIVPAWSLSIELQFYILAPLLLILCKRVGLPVLLLSIVVSIAMLFFKVGSVTGIVYLPYFLIGGLIYLYNFKVSEKLAIICLLIGGVYLLLNYLIPDLRVNYLFLKNSKLLAFNYGEMLNCFLALLTIPFLTINIRQKRKSQPFFDESLLSSMSYVIYLLHWPLLKVYALSVRNVGSFQKIAHLCLYYVICLLLSWIIAKYVDTWFESHRRKWLKHEEIKVNSTVNSQLSL